MSAAPTVTLPFAFAQFPVFLLVFARVAAIVVSMPLLGEGTVPAQVKVAMALLLSLLLYPLVSAGFADRVPAAGLAWVPALVMEVLVGGVIGFTVRLITAAFEFAGEVTGWVLGLSLAQAVDPQTHLQVPIVGQFLTVLGFLTFLAINAHHVLIAAMVQSFAWVPPFAPTIGAGFADVLVDLAFNLFRLGLQIAAPVVAAMLLVNVAMGIVSRAVPQMHVMLVAMPLSIAVGFIVLGVSLPYIGAAMVQAYGGLGSTLAGVLGSMG
jgi:flagellar biosynthetic protein FliR